MVENRQDRQAAREKSALNARLESAGIPKMHTVLVDLYSQVLCQDPALPNFKVYESFSAKLPGKLSNQKQAEVLKAAQDEGNEQQPQAKEVFVLLNVGTVLKAAKPYFTESEQDNDDLVQSGLSYLLHRLPSIPTDSSISLKTYSSTISSYGILSAKAAQIGTSVINLRDKRQEEPSHPQDLSIERDNVQETDQTSFEEEVLDTLLKPQIEAALSKAITHLKPKQQITILGRFGFEGKPLTYEAIAQQLNVPRQTVWLAETSAISRLRKRPLDELVKFARFPEDALPAQQPDLFNAHAYTEELRPTFPFNKYLPPSRINYRYADFVFNPYAEQYGFPSWYGISTKLDTLPKNLGKLLHDVGGIKNLAQLLGKTEQDLLRIEGIGPQDAQEIKEALVTFLIWESTLETCADILTLRTTLIRN